MVILEKKSTILHLRKPSSGPAVTRISPAGRSRYQILDILHGVHHSSRRQALPDEELHSPRSSLHLIGDSIVLVADDEIVKVHVHTNHPGQAFEKALTYGALSRMKIDNMREEHQEKLIKDAEKLAREQEEQEKKEAAAKAAKEHKKYGFISVSVGEGLSTLFKELNVDYIIEGGQTMNPSTEDMLNAIAEVNADTIYIFPNNKNIVLAANQARDLTEDKEIVVVPTKTIPQGITALISFQPEMNGEENLEAMMEAVSMVKTGQVTYAVRDTRLDEKEIHEGDIMGIGDHGILAVGKGRENVAKEMVAAMVDEDSEVISIYYGAETTEEDAESLAAELEEAYPDCEVEVNVRWTADFIITLFLLSNECYCSLITFARVFL
ncbi:MAG: DAK2 domain-containing protein [Ruminococcus sp.]